MGTTKDRIRAQEAETMALVAKNAISIQAGVFVEAQRIHERKLEVMHAEHQLSVEISQARASLAEDEKLMSLADQSDHFDTKLALATRRSYLSGLRAGLVLGAIGGTSIAAMALGSFIL